MHKLLLIALSLGWLCFATLPPAVSQTNACPARMPATPPAFTYDSTLLDERDLEAMVAPQILTYLNIVGVPDGLAQALAVPISDRARIHAVEVMQTDVTGDALPEVLIQFGVSYGTGDGGFDGLLLLFGCEDGAYVQWHASQFYGWTCDQPIGFSKIEDTNANSVPEIFHTYVANAGIGGCWNTFRVLQWDGAALLPAHWDWAFVGSAGAYANCGFAAYISDQPRLLPENTGGSWQFTDVDADQTAEILIVNPGDSGSGVYYPCAEIWEWSDADTLTLGCIQRYVTADLFRANIAELLATAEDALFCGYAPAAVEHYRLIITNPDLPNYPYPRDSSIDERAYLTAFAYYRLLQIHTSRADHDAAAVDYAALRETFPPDTPGYAYAEMARVFWEALGAEADLQAACAALDDYAAERLRPQPAGEDSFDAYYFANGYFTFEYDPDNLYLGCPLWMTEL